MISTSCHREAPTRQVRQVYRRALASRLATTPRHCTVTDDGSLTLRLRLPDPLVWKQGKYLVIHGVRFKYGHERVLAALESDAEYSASRRQHGEKAVRASGLGQAICYRFKRDSKGWRVFVTTRMAVVPVVTDRKQVAVGVDLNRDRLAVCETDTSGNYV